MEQYISAAPVASFIFVFTLVTSIYGLYINPNLNQQFMLHPYSVARGKKYHTILTSGLIHGDTGHLAFNMLTFFFFAFSLEQIIGHWQFGLLYVLGLILSDASTLIKHKNHPWYFSLGASGAISAVLFSYILFQPMSKIYLFFIPLGIPAFVFGFLYLIYCVYAAKQQTDNVNHDAHFYGALTGIIFTIILFPGIIAYFISQVF